MTLDPRSAPARVTAWLDRWSVILPLLFAEFVVWVGFGALLPIMPLYFTEHGVDFATLGVVVAAWPAARLVGEPVFGWVADRVPRVPLMVVGNVGAGIFEFLPLLLIGPEVFIALRALAGLSTAVYDPAARGYITDATPPERRGEAFGLYGAAQMGGLLFGPAIGGLGSAAVGGVAFVFVFCGASSILAAVIIALRVRESAQTGRHRVTPSIDYTELRAEPVPLWERAAVDALEDEIVDAPAPTPGLAAPPVAAPGPGRPARAAPRSLVNRLLLVAVFLNLGSNIATGTYEVVWSLFLTGLGAGVDLVGLTFAMFGLPVLILSPWFGRRVDRGSVLPFLVAGSVLPAVTGIWYTLIGDPIHAVPLILLEATGFAALSPALYTLVAAGSPVGRSSTAQGLYGAAGTVGFVAASLATGVLAEADIRYPFYVFSAAMALSLGVALVVGGRRLGRPLRGAAATPVSPPDIPNQLVES